MASIPQFDIEPSPIRCCLRCKFWNRLPNPEPEGVCEVEEVKDYNKSMIRPVTKSEETCSGFKPRFKVFVSDKFGNAVEESKAHNRP